MAKKKQEDRMFVQLGKTYPNGRIAKMERYDINNFVEYLFPTIQTIKGYKVTYLDKLFKTKTYRMNQEVRLINLFAQEMEAMQLRVHTRIVDLIQKDNYGKGKK